MNENIFAQRVLVLGIVLGVIILFFYTFADLKRRLICKILIF